MWAYNYIFSFDELHHHGIKGMRWGVRRFQNSDGSLTPAGRKRYSENVTNAKSAMNVAKAEQKAANKAYNEAYNRYNLVPTNTNYKKLVESQRQLKSSNSSYKQAKLGYKVAKANEDGIFDSSKKKSDHQLRLEEKYQKQGHTAQEATIMARDRIQTEKLLTTAAALTVTACAAYAANQYVKNRTGQILESGSLLQRIEMTNTDGKLHDVFYASTGSHDNKRYEGVLGFTRKMQTGQAYMMKLETNKDIKVASKESASKVFGDLYKNDSDFRDAVKDSVSQHLGGSNKIRNIDDVSDRNLRKMYDNFNSALINIREGGSGADTKFYNKLKSAGYDAIQDINDMKYSGYHAKNPLIVFNNSAGNVMVKSVKELTKDDGLGKKAAIEIGKGSIEGMAELMVSPYTAVALTGGAAAMYVSDYATTSKKKSTK